MNSIASLQPAQGANTSFELREEADYAVLTFPQCVDYRAAKDFLEKADGWISLPFKVLILDLHSVTKLEQTIFRPLVVMHQAIKKKGGCMMTVNASHTMLQIIQAAGLDSVFSPRANMHAALSSAGIKSSKGLIDVNFLNPFIEATQSTIESHARTKIKVGKPFAKKGEAGIEEMEIAGVISMISNAFQGSIALCFPRQVFLLIYSNMMGKPCTEISRETEDAAGELLNIIFGKAKVKLKEHANYTIREAVPTVVKGSELSVHHTAWKPALVIPFETEVGVFHIEISADAA